MTDTYYGIYRAVIEDTQDPERINRYRVRVMQLDSPNYPVAHLPWAENAAGFASKGSSDLPVFMVGDRVWVMFEAGDRYKPVIIGSWACRFGGVLDGSQEILADYATGRERHRRQDREGNLVEVSEKADEIHVRLASGDTTLVMSKLDGSIRLLSSAGKVTLGGKTILAAAAQFLAECGNLSLLANEEVLGLPTGVLDLTANREVSIGVPEKFNPEGEVNIGQKVVESMPQQTYLVRALGKIVELGQYAGSGGFLDTLIARVRALQQVLIQAGLDVEIKAARNLTVEAASASSTIRGKATLNVMEVKVTVQGGVEVTAGGSVNVTAADSVSVNATSINLLAASSVTIQAPSVNVIP
jgi:hypothetical protein